MSARWLPAVLLLGTVVTSGTVAQEESEHHSAPPPAGVCCPPPCEKTFHATNIVLYQRQEVGVEPQLAIREVTNTVPTKSVEVEYKEEKRCVTILVSKPHEIEQVVESMTCVPQVTLDPCTGCPCTTWKQVPICKTVKVTVYEQVPETKELTIRVPVLKPIDTQVTVTQLSADWSTRPVTFTRYGAAIIPVEIKVPAVPCPGLPPPPPVEGPPPCCAPGLPLPPLDCLIH